MWVKMCMIYGKIWYSVPGAKTANIITAHSVY